MGGGIRIDAKEIGVNTRNCVDQSQDRDNLESPCECGIESPGFVNHGISYLDGIPRH